VDKKFSILRNIIRGLYIGKYPSPRGINMIWGGKNIIKRKRALTKKGEKERKDKEKEKKFTKW
jgi:hypothetical protein